MIPEFQLMNHDLSKAIRIKQIKEEVKGFKSFVFEENHTISYKAGQYLTLLQTSPDGVEVRRSYSITSSPVLNEPLSIGVKRIENGFFSRQLIDVAKAGDKLQRLAVAGFLFYLMIFKTLSKFSFLLQGAASHPFIRW